MATKDTLIRFYTIVPSKPRNTSLFWSFQNAVAWLHSHSSSHNTQFTSLRSRWITRCAVFVYWAWRGTIHSFGYCSLVGKVCSFLCRFLVDKVRPFSCRFRCVNKEQLRLQHVDDENTFVHLSEDAIALWVRCFDTPFIWRMLFLNE